MTLKVGCFMHNKVVLVGSNWAPGSCYKPYLEDIARLDTVVVDASIPCPMPGFEWQGFKLR